MNKQDRQRKAREQKTVRWCPERRGVGVVEGNGVKYTVWEGDLTLGGEHTTHCTAHVSQNCTLETYVVLLTKVTPMNLIKI